MPTPSVEGELLARSLNEELHDVVAPADLATSVIQQHWRGRRRRRVVLGPLVASLAAVAAVLALLLPTINRAATTPRWTLVGDVSPSWHETPSQGLTQSFFLTCPSATTCYARRPKWYRGHTRRGQDLGRRGRRPTPLRRAP